MRTLRQKAPPVDIVDHDGTTYRHIDSLVEGDRVDLIGDPYADPILPETVTRIYGLTREVVADINPEGRRVRVHFMSGHSLLFPRDHWFVMAEE